MVGDFNGRGWVSSRWKAQTLDECKSVSYLLPYPLSSFVRFDSNCAGICRSYHLLIDLKRRMVVHISFTGVITYHNPENKPKGGICVANHTSPIDVLLLACDNVYALVSDIFFYLLSQGSFQLLSYLIAFIC